MRSVTTCRCTNVSCEWRTSKEQSGPWTRLNSTKGGLKGPLLGRPTDVTTLFLSLSLHFLSLFLMIKTHNDMDPNCCNRIYWLATSIYIYIQVIGFYCQYKIIGSLPCNKRKNDKLECHPDEFVAAQVFREI